MRMSLLKKFQENLEYTFQDISLLENALTHSSYANESRSKVQSNERLEFLGDAVLSIVVSDYIFSNCPGLPEGELTKLRASLVCEQALCTFSLSLNVGDFLLLSRGEKNSGGEKRPSILADTFEALIAAIYLDGGIESARKFVLRFIIPEVKKPRDKKFMDYKTRLQEIVQQSPNERLEYVMVGESGPDHDKHFVFEVRLNNNVIGKGGGHSKKDAEQQAAREALELMGQ